MVPISKEAQSMVGVCTNWPTESPSNLREDVNYPNIRAPDYPCKKDPAPNLVVMENYKDRETVEAEITSSLLIFQ